MSPNGISILAILLAAWLAGPVAATHQGPQDLNALDLNLLVYHPLPDEEGDPWGVAALRVNGTPVDWMAGYYGAFFFPTAAFDGVEIIESTPTVEGAGAYQETYAAYRDRLEKRLDASAPVEVHIEAGVQDEVLRGRVTTAPTGLLDEDGLVLRLVYFEDDVAYAGGNGIVNHRFVVRGLSSPEPLPGDARMMTPFQFRIPSFVDPERFGMVAIVQNTDESSAVFRAKEVLQSASWTTRQAGSTHQVSRGVLLELYSATWCAACVYGDSASDVLADEFGLQSTRGATSGWEYLRPVHPLHAAVAALLGTGVAVWLLRATKRSPAP